jgi:4-hydroxybenzoyl-CoA thioesterase
MKSYRHHVTVHWGDTDPAKIVHYPNYFGWYDESTLMLFDSVGLGWNELLARYEIIGLPIVEAKSRFFASCRFLDRIVIESSINSWSNKSFEVIHRVTNRGVTTAEGHEIRVLVKAHPEDPARLKACEIPAEIRSAFE